MRRLIRNKALAATCAATVLALSTPAFAQTELTFDQARQLGRQASLQGDVRLAFEFSDSLLAANPADFDALIIRASALLQIDAPREARRAAAAAYQSAPEALDRYEAARLAALAARNEERFGLAQFWLRLASVHAPTEADEEQSLTDAAAMRSLSRWQTSVRLSFSPSDNVNGASPNAELIIDGQDYSGLLSRDAQALDGWEGSLAFSARYRLRETSDWRLSTGISGAWNTVWLSDEARSELIEDDRYFGNEAFSTRQLEANLRYDRAVEDGSWSVTTAGGLRHTFDDDDLEVAHFLRLNIDRTLVLDPRNVLRGSAYIDQAWDVDTSRRDRTRTGLSATYIYGFQNRTIVSATLAYAETDGDILNNRYTSWTVSSTIQPADPVGPFQITANLGYQFTEFPDYGIIIPVPGGRQDNRIFAGLDLALPDYAIAGFEPVITFDATSTTSNVSRFEYDTFGVGFTFQSSF